MGSEMCIRDRSRHFLIRGIKNYYDAIQYVKKLPYGRNSDKTDLTMVLSESKGTCSTKHALLAQLASENDLSSIELMLGIYRMQEKNTPGVGKVLAKYDLAYIPEAHNYLRYGGKRFDFTMASSSQIFSFEHFLEEEIVISPKQITAFKVDYHKQFIANWLKKSGKEFTLEEIWTIREACILALQESEN